MRYTTVVRDVAQSDITFVYDFMAPHNQFRSHHGTCSYTQEQFNRSRTLTFQYIAEFINRLTKLKRQRTTHNSRLFPQHSPPWTQPALPYHFAETPTTTTEKHRMILKEDVFNFSIDKKINNWKALWIDAFQCEQQDDAFVGTWKHSSTPNSQRVRRARSECERLYYLFFAEQRAWYTFATTVVDYHYCVMIYISMQTKRKLIQTLHNNNEVSWHTSKKYYNFSIDLQHLNVHNGQ